MVGSKWFRSPWVEALVLLAGLGVSAVALALIAWSARHVVVEDGLSTPAVAGALAGCFGLSVMLAVVAVLGGIGGAVLFTPVMLAFTPINSLVVRATGLVLGLFSGLVRTGVFMRKGLGNLRLVALMTVGQGLGALLGAKAAIYVYDALGQQGEALIRVTLGLILAAISLHFLLGGAKLNYPGVRRVDRFTLRLKLPLPYYEASEGRILYYRLTRAGWGLAAIFLVGLVGGFFGMGGGWATTPVMNLIMGAPLKVAAANSGIVVGTVNSIAAWPYLRIGAMIPLFVLPWIAGQAVGGYLGSLLLMRIKVGLIRPLLIGILFFTSFGLITRGLELLELLETVPPVVSIAVLLVILAGVVGGMLREKRRAVE